MSALGPALVKLEGGQKFQRLLAGIPSTCGMKSGYVVLAPGESVGEHETLGKEEAIVIIEGKADVYCAQELKFTADKDNLVYIPPQTSHDIKNSGTDMLRYIYIVSPVTS